jgi:predicted TIM-barrel fold metal-dependent hydrolase
MSGVVDAFVHPEAENGMGSLLAHMPRAWKKRFTGLGLASSECFRGASLAELQTRAPLDGDRDLDVMVPLEMVNAWPDKAVTTTILGAANEYFLQEWLPKDNHLRYAALVCGQDPDWSAAEVRRCARNDGVAAVAIAPMHVLLGSPSYYPLYEACQEAQLPLIVYPTGAEALYIGAPQTAAGAPATYLERRVILPQVAQANISSVVFDGIFDRFPELRLMFAGFGFSWLLPLLWRMDMDWRRGRVETPWVKRPPSEYVRDHVRLTTEPGDGPADLDELTLYLEMSMADQVLVYGSNFAGGDTDTQRTLLQRVPERLSARISSEAARECFRFGGPPGGKREG